MSHGRSSADMPVKVSAFNVIFQNDPSITRGPAVVLVYNAADDPANPAGPGKKSKWGRPGGGQESEDYDSPDDTAVREGEGETGLKIVSRVIFGEFPKIIALIKDSALRRLEPEERGKRSHPLFYAYHKGERPSVEQVCQHFRIFPRDYTFVDNHYPVYRTTVRWDGSTQQRILRRERARQLANREIRPEQADQDGVFVRFRFPKSQEELSRLAAEQNVAENDVVPLLWTEAEIAAEAARRQIAVCEVVVPKSDLTVGEMNALGIADSEKEEIRGIALVTLDYIRYELDQIRNQKPGEPRHNAFAYKGHMEQILEVWDSLSKAEQQVLTTPTTPTTPVKPTAKVAPKNKIRGKSKNKRR